MNLKETIKKDFITAFKNKDLEKKTVLSMLNSEIKNAEIDLKNREEGLSDEKVLVVIKKNVKQRKDAAEKYKAGEREDLAAKEQVEMEILKSYLPAELSSEKVREVVEEVIAEKKANEMSQMGLVMSESMKKLNGQADGNVVREIVTELLQK